MKRKVAIKFNCPVWSMQQLNNEANAMRPGHLPKMVDTPECRSFAENCNFCFVMGIPTRTGQFPFTARKHRRASELAPIVLTLDGAQARILDTRDQWVLDDRTRSVVSRADQQRLYGVMSGGHDGEPNGEPIEEAAAGNGSTRGSVIPSQRAAYERARDRAASVVETNNMIHQ
jgi:hypothetical protein